MRLKIAPSAGRTESAYFYPDCFVRCGPTPAAQATEVDDPTLIVEVLSPSTEDFDRTEKFAVYLTIACLQEVAFVNSDPAPWSRRFLTRRERRIHPGRDR